MGVPKAFDSGAAGGRRRPGRLSAQAWVDVLRDVPLFEGVSDRHLRKIAGLGTIATYVRDSTVVRRGEPGDACFVVLEGNARVITGRGRPGIPLRPGAVFGEMALLDDAPRTASVIADTELVLYRLGRAQFTKLLRAEPGVSLALLRTLSARLRALQGA
jgi:CRP-like cAMP-binding protein